MNNVTNWLLAVIIVLLMSGGVYWIYTNENKNPVNTGTESGNNNSTTNDSSTTENLPALSKAVDSQDHKMGPDGAKVVLVEYSDFQCPACQQLSPTFISMVDKFPGQVQFVYRHFPLSFHPLATEAAKISEAAAKKGKFFEMADFYFKNPSFTIEKAYEQAATLGLDVDQIKAEIANGDYDKTIEDSIASGNQSGVGGTPTMFMNGKQLPWEQTVDLENIIKKELGQ